MSKEIAIRVKKLSKAFRIGLKDQQHETLMGAAAAWIKSPLANFRSVRNLSRFEDPDKTGTGHAAKKGQNDIFWALRDVSFNVKKGEAIGIIGRNGAGKSTLLKILSRITEPTTGKAEIYGRVGSLLEVGTGFHPDLSGRENVYLNGTILGMKKREIDKRFDEIVDFSGVEQFVDTPVKRYSSGMRVRLAFSVAAHLEPEILIVDEVLAVGDADFQRKCLGKMGEVTGHGRTVLFVSHNMEAVLTLCNSGIVLEGGQLGFMGEASEAVQFYQRGGVKKDDEKAPHVVWAATGKTGATEHCIDKIEMLDLEGRPKPIVQTWDDVCFRIHYTAKESVPSGSIVLEIRDYRDTRMFVMDSGLRFPLREGSHYVDCVVPKMPLSAGEYFVGAGLALTNAQWLWRNSSLAAITINGRDVFELGRPPVNTRMLFAVPHEWNVRID